MMGKKLMFILSRVQMFALNSIFFWCGLVFHKVLMVSSYLCLHFFTRCRTEHHASEVQWTLCLKKREEMGKNLRWGHWGFNICLLIFAFREKKSVLHSWEVNIKSSIFIQEIWCYTYLWVHNNLRAKFSEWK